MKHGLEDDQTLVTTQHSEKKLKLYADVVLGIFRFGSCIERICFNRQQARRLCFNQGFVLVPPLASGRTDEDGPAELQLAVGCGLGIA